VFESLTRRDLLKRAAQMAALSVIAGGLPGPTHADVAAMDGLKWSKAPCRFCGTGCGVLVGVLNGKVVAVQGDQDCGVNRGLLCAKGYHAGAILYGEDRLTKPMIRKRGKLVEATWDEAITKVAKNILKDTKKFAFYGSGQWTIPEGYLAMKFTKGGLGNNHLDPNARLCMASAVVGFIKTFGVDEPMGCYEDLDECDTVLTWGNNWAEMHPVLFSRFIDRRGPSQRYNSGRSRITYIDIATRRTRSTEAADHFLEFIPQTDLAIANCVAQQLIERRTWDKKFVSEKVRFKGNDGKDVDFNSYKAFLRKFTPEKVEKISGVPASQLKMLGDIFSDPTRKVVSLWCMGVNQHTRGTAMNNLIYNIHLLSGKIGKHGSTPFSLTGQPSACGTCREVGTLAHALPGGRVVKVEQHRKEVEKVWKTKPGAISPKPGYHAVKMFRAFSSGELKSMWVQVTNPAHSMPNLHATIDGAKDRFLVVSDVYPTETTKIADVVFPSALWVEKNGLYGNSERRTQQWFGMVDPPGEARDDTWQIIAVAHKLYEMGFEGMTNRNGDFLLEVRDDDGKAVEAWKWEVFKKFNVDRATFNEYRLLSFKKTKNLAPYDEYVKAHGIRWPVKEYPGGVWKETPRRYIEGEDPFVKKGKGIDFYHAKAGDGRAIIWQRPYDPPPEVPNEDFPFWLCTGRVLEHWHTGTMTGQVKELKKAMPHAYVELHPEDARKMGIFDGDMVKIESRRGSIVLPARVGGRAMPQKGSVFVPFFDPTMLINKVTLDAFDPFSKQPDYKKCAVRLGRVQS
jgi:nitrate reductase NapA